MRKRLPPPSRKHSTNSPSRSKNLKTKMTGCRFKLTVEGPFYSDAMKCWRIQVREQGITFDKAKEASMCIQFNDDMAYIRPLMRGGIETWDDWTRFVGETKRYVEQYGVKGYVTVVGYGSYESFVKREQKI